MTDDEKNALRPVKPGEFMDALSHSLQFLGRKRVHTSAPTPCSLRQSFWFAWTSRDAKYQSRYC